MTSTLGPLGGAGGDKQLDKLLLDVLQSGLAQPGVSSQCTDAQDGLQNLRDLINGNQRNAARQCQHTQHLQSERTGNGPGREGVMQMLTKLMMLVMPMLQHKQKADGHCQPTHNAQRLAMSLQRR